LFAPTRYDRPDRLQNRTERSGAGQCRERDAAAVVARAENRYLSPMSSSGRTGKSWVKPTTEYGPLAVFFIAYLKWDLLTATAALIGATAIALALSLAVERRVPMMPLITAIIVGVFGGLTLWLQDETFIKMKPTIVEALFSAVLFGGLAFGRSLLKPLMGAAWPMDDVGWRKLTFRFAVFFAAMAVLNEIVWRTQSTDFWVTFKVFGLMGLTFAFAIAQTPLLRRHGIEPADEDANP
jgi:intracellular septation protein